MAEQPRYSAIPNAQGGFDILLRPLLGNQPADIGTVGLPGRTAQAVMRASEGGVPDLGGGGTGSGASLTARDLKRAQQARAQYAGAEAPDLAGDGDGETTGTSELADALVKKAEKFRQSTGQEPNDLEDTAFDSSTVFDEPAPPDMTVSAYDGQTQDVDPSWFGNLRANHPFVDKALDVAGALRDPLADAAVGMSQVDEFGSPAKQLAQGMGGSLISQGAREDRKRKELVEASEREHKHAYENRYLDILERRADAAMTAAERSGTASAETAAAEKASEQADIAGNIVQDSVSQALGILSAYPDGLNGVTGPWAQAAAHINGSNRAQFDSFLLTIKAHIGFSQLQAMRAASKTGSSGLGALTRPEQQALESMFGNIEANQQPAYLEYNLVRLNNAYLDTIHGIGEGPARMELPPVPERPYLDDETGKYIIRRGSGEYVEISAEEAERRLRGR